MELRQILIYGPVMHIFFSIYRHKAILISLFLNRDCFFFPDLFHSRIFLLKYEKKKRISSIPNFPFCILEIDYLCQNTLTQKSVVGGLPGRNSVISFRQGKFTSS